MEKINPLNFISKLMFSYNDPCFDIDSELIFFSFFKNKNKNRMKPDLTNAVSFLS